MAFRGLIYTDCRREESLRGGTGYQFQAASSGTTASDETTMLKHIVYQPPADLMARSAPVAEYPVSFAFHAGPDGYALGTGSYLGEVSGDGRQGNHITHALFTDDVDDFSHTRPAQLFGAHFWLGEKRPSKELDIVEPPLVYLTEFDLPVLRKLAENAQFEQGPEEFLAKLLSAFERAAGAAPIKTILSCTDPLETMQWIALGTLLLAEDQALATSIRMYVADPMSAPQAIVAYHPPSSNRPLNIARVADVAGIDLDTKTTNTIAITERGRFWAHKFLSEDPFDVADAVQFASALSSSDRPGRIASGVLNLGHRLANTSEVDALVDALEQLDSDDFSEFADTLIDALTATEQWDDLGAAPFVRAIRAVSGKTRGSSAYLDQLQTNLLVRAATAPALAATLVTEQPERWDWHSRQSADSSASRSLVAVIAALDDSLLAGGFTLAARSRLPIPVNEVKDAAERLAQQWAANPELTAQRRGWLHSDVVTDSLVSALADGVSRGGGDAIAADMAAGQWDWLLDFDWVVSGGNPIMAEIANRAIPAADPARQEALVRTIAGGVGAGGWRKLWGGRDPSILEVHTWLEVQPHDVDDPEFARAVGNSVATALHARQLEPRLLALIGDLAARAVHTLPRAVQDVAHQDHHLSAVVRGIDRRNENKGLGRELALTPPAILTVRMGEVVDALLTHAEPEETAEFLSRTKVDPKRHVVDGLNRLAYSYPAPAFRTAINLQALKVPKSVAAELNNFVLDWYEHADERSRRGVQRELGADYDADWANLEEQFARKHESKVQKLGRMFGGREKGR